VRSTRVDAPALAETGRPQKDHERHCVGEPQDVPELGQGLWVIEELALQGP
jgi:hypothetical protein